MEICKNLTVQMNKNFLVNFQRIDTISKKRKSESYVIFFVVYSKHILFLSLV